MKSNYTVDPPELVALQTTVVARSEQIESQREQTWNYPLMLSGEQVGKRMTPQAAIDAAILERKSASKIGQVTGQVLYSMRLSCSEQYRKQSNEA